MIKDFRDFTDNNIIYLWVLHGVNVSAHNNYYPIDIKFRNIIFYSKPYEEIYSDTLYEFKEHPCKILTGSCPIFPVKDKNNRKIVYLPPLFFSPSNDNNDDSPEVRNMMGLYKFNIKDCQKKLEDGLSNQFQKIYDFDMLMNLHPFGTKITYSQLFKYILDDCTLNNYDVNEIMVGIFSCQAPYEQYINKYYKNQSATLKKPYVQNVNNVEKATIFDNNSITNLNNDDVIELTSVKHDLNKIKNFSALGKITHQGCAINVFTYYDIIQDENRAREIVMCLPSKGTSIFKIVDHINSYITLQKQQNNNDVIYSNCDNNHKIIKGYLILRFNIEIALNFLLKYAKDSLNNDTNFVIIFKLYNQSENTKQVHSGHTISFSKINNNYYLIDPQISSNLNMNEIVNNYDDDNFEDIENLSNYLMQKYNKNQMDLIFTIYEKNNTNYHCNNETLQHFNDEHNIQASNVVTRINDIYFGGNNSITKLKNTNANYKKKRKTKTKKSKKYSMKKYSTKKYSTKNKSKKLNKSLKLTNKIYNDDDDFEKLMKKIDNENGIQTSLITSDVNVPI